MTRRSEFRPKLVVVRREVEVACNGCPNVASKETDPASFYAYRTFEIAGGWYGPKSAPDGTVVRFDLCPDCIDGLVSRLLTPAEEIRSMTVPPVVVKHAETGDLLVVERDWLRALDEELPEEEPEPYDPRAPLCVWEDIEGKLYDVLGIVTRVGTNDLWVVYRPLFDRSELLTMSVEQFIEPVEVGAGFLQRFAPYEPPGVETARPGIGFMITKDGATCLEKTSR
jgi:hypothetical protein